MAPNGIGLFGAFMVLSGALAPLIAIFFWRGARKQLNWVPVRGVIRASEVRWEGEFFETRIEYTYSSGGREFRGTRVRSLTMLVSWRGPSQKRVGKYPTGSEVIVFVDPENPRESVLEPGGDPKFLPMILTVSAVLLVLGLAALGAFR